VEDFLAEELRAAKRQALLRQYDREVTAETQRDAEIERANPGARSRTRRARALGHPKGGALRTASIGSPRRVADAKARAPPVSFRVVIHTRQIDKRGALSARFTKASRALGLF
jgi:hypothetical protein